MGQVSCQLECKRKLEPCQRAEPFNWPVLHIYLCLSPMAATTCLWSDCLTVYWAELCQVQLTLVTCIACMCKVQHLTQIEDTLNENVEDAKWTATLHRNLGYTRVFQRKNLHGHTLFLPSYLDSIDSPFCFIVRNNNNVMNFVMNNKLGHWCCPCLCVLAPSVQRKANRNEWILLKCSWTYTFKKFSMSDFVHPNVNKANCVLF